MGSPCFASFGYASGLTIDTTTDFPVAAGYTFTPVLPLTGGAALLRHPIAWLVPDRFPHRLTCPRRDRPVGVVSITGFTMGALMRVREYQPVVHRLRLSASP